MSRRGYGDNSGSVGVLAEGRVAELRPIDGSSGSSRSARPRRAAVPVKMLVRASALALVGTLVTGASLYVALTWATGRVATSRAIAHARQLGEIDARAVFAPYVTDDALRGEPVAVDALDAVTNRYLAVSGAIRVKVWDLDARILYSDEAHLIGRQFTLEAEDLEVFRSHKSSASLTNLTNPENEFERSHDRLLQVYVFSTTETGTPVLIETYYPYRLVTETAEDIRGRFLPIMVGAVALLALVQLPTSIGLSLRLQRARYQRTALLERLLTVSDSERRRVAGEVHDGAVQELIGLNYAIGGIAARSAETESQRLRELSGDLSGIIRRLRDLLTSIYPNQRVSGSMRTSIDAMAESLRASGMDVTVDIASDIKLQPTEEVVVLRAVGELTKNIESHSRASNVTIRVAAARDRTLVDVIDDGVGFESPADERERRGHFGLRLLADLAADTGGSLAITAEPGQGTRARFELPSER
jgi:two-component system, NarL family, sensor kinase